MICCCGKETTNPKYCSHACANTATAPVRMRRLAIPCPQCGRVFEVLRNRSASRRHCSRACASEANREYRNCPQCGERFSGRIAKTHCSYACSRLAMRKGVGGTARWTDPVYRRSYMTEYFTVNRVRLNAQKQEYKRRNPEKFREIQRRRRAAGRSVGVYLRMQRAVVKAIGRCLKCGAVERLELDHVVAVVAGGPDVAENFQVLCRRCNAAKAGATRDYRDETTKGLIMAACHGVNVELVRSSRGRGWR